MMLKFLFCFSILLHTSWSANEYLFTNSHRTNVGSQHSNGLQPIAAPKKYNVEYFFFKAPDDDSKEEQDLTKHVTSVKRRQQVVIIKTPENNAYEKAIQNHVKNSVQQNDHIYVLHKEPDYTGLQQQLQTIQKTIHHKPEVNFINYRNSHDVEHIQSSLFRKYSSGGEGTGSKFVNTLNGSTNKNSNYINNNLNNNNRINNYKNYNSNNYNNNKIYSNNEPVGKNYARNFLPTGVDVVPGSSYIPLHRI